MLGVDPDTGPTVIAGVRDGRGRIAGVRPPPIADAPRRAGAETGAGLIPFA